MYVLCTHLTVYPPRNLSERRRGFPGARIDHVLPVTRPCRQTCGKFYHTADSYPNCTIRQPSGKLSPGQTALESTDQRRRGAAWKNRRSVHEQYLFSVSADRNSSRPISSLEACCVTQPPVRIVINRHVPSTLIAARALTDRDCRSSRMKEPPSVLQGVRKNLSTNLQRFCISKLRCHSRETIFIEIHMYVYHCCK